MKSVLVCLLSILITFDVHGTTSAHERPGSRMTSPSITIGPMSDGPAISASEAYARIAPSVALVETPAGFGSGVLIEGNYLLTNAHVVYPYEEVRVVFADGTEFLHEPVYAQDLMVDLALVGPIETSLPPLALVDGSDIEVGRSLYQVGYPAAIGAFPQPAITEGILSNVRVWEPFDLTLFRSDATSAGGQSGGVMATRQGEVIGITTFGADGFSLATSIGDAQPHLEAMLVDGLVNTLSKRRIDFASGSTTHEGVLHNKADERTYVLSAPSGTEVELQIDGMGVSVFSVVDEYGTTHAISNFKGETGAVAKFSLLSDLLHYVRVTQLLDTETPFTLTASHPLIFYEDPDDGTGLERGETVGFLDTPFDTDYYDVDLDAGEAVEISVDSYGTDTMIFLHYLGRDREEFVSDDDSGGGIFGTDDSIIYRAPGSGRYRLSVGQAGESVTTGGYILTFQDAEPTAEPSIIDISRPLVEMPAGQMTLYESEDYALEMLYPFDRSASPFDECWTETRTFCVDGFDVDLTVSENDLAFLPARDRELERYVDYLLDYHDFDLPGFQLISREPITTLQGLVGESFVFFTDMGRSIGTGVAFIDEANGVAFDAVYFASSDEQYDRLAPLFAESFASYRSWAGADRQTDPIHFLDLGIRHMTGGNITEALATLDRAIELDHDLVPAYVHRAHVHFALDNSESLVADLDQAILRSPEEPALYYDKAELLYRAGKIRDAREAIDQGIWLFEFEPNMYSLSAKIASIEREIDLAFSDLNDSYLLSEGNISWDAWATQAFVYLMAGEFEDAAIEYDGLYEGEWLTLNVQLGRGIAYAEVGENEEAFAILEQGMEEVTAEDMADDPQLALLYKMAKEAQSKLAE